MTGASAIDGRRSDGAVRDVADTVASLIVEESLRGATRLVEDDAVAQAGARLSRGTLIDARPSRWLWPFVWLLVVAALLVALFAPYHLIGANPMTFAALVVAVVLIDICRIDVFERARVSPAAIPELALALVFGPLGPITAEAVIAVGRAFAASGGSSSCSTSGR